MRRLVLSCVMLLTACSENPDVQVKPLPVQLDDELLVPCNGHTGPVPTTEIEFVKATAAEKAGRLCNANKLEAVGEIVRRHNTRAQPS